MGGDSGVRRVPAPGGGLPELDAADVLFETTDGSLAVVSESGFARFSAGALLAPGDPGGAPLAEWLAGYFGNGRVTRAFGGARITDARDLALAMVSAAEQRLSGHFAVLGPWMEYQQILAHFESTTGRESRGGGAVVLHPGAATFFGESFPMTLRPLAETLHDVRVWHESRPRAGVMVA